MTEAEIDELLKNTNDLLANENLQSEEEKPEGTPDLVNQIDTAIEPPKQEEQVKEELPKATPSPLPSPVATPPKEPELDLNKPSNVVLSILGDRDQEDFDAADLELIDGLEDGKDLYELSKARPDISLNTDQARKIFEYQRTASPYTKVPENAADWYNLTDAALEDVGDVLSMTGEMVWGGMKGAAKAVQYGTPALLGMNSTYAEALALEKKLPPEKRGEVEAWRKRAWQIASTPLKGGEQPSPDSYTDEKYLQKVKENLPPEKATEAQKTEQEFQEKRYKAKQVPYSILDELAGLPISLNFLGTKVGTGGMQTWDNISEKFGLQDKEKSFENWLARNEIDTAQAKMMKAEPRAFARVVQTYYAPAMKSFTNLLHPSVKEYMIMYPELSMEEAQAKRAEQIDSDVQTTIEDIKKDIPETDPDQAMFGSLAIPGQFGLDNFGFAYNVLSATKQLTPLVRTKLRQMRYTDDQINAFEKQAQQALRAKELKRLEKLEKPGMVERAAGATAKGIEKAGDYFERSPTWQKIGKATPVVSGAMLGYQLDPENPLQSLAVGSLGGAVGIPVAKQTLKTITEIPKSIKEISAARRISAGGAQGPLATLKTIAQQQDEVKTLSAKLKTYAEGTDDYIETEKLLKDAKDKLKGIKAGGTDVIDYQGIGKVSDTTKRILRFVNDDMVSNIGEYAKLGIEPTLVGLATGIIDSSDEEELKTMIGQGLAFSLGGRAVQQSFNKFIGEDPVIAARKSRQANVDAFKAYRDSSPETRGEIDQLTDWDNVINRQTTKAEKAQIALQELQAKGADPAKIAEAEKAATAEQKSLSLLKTANVQTRNEFGRQFLQQLGRNNMLLNGSLKAGQNNVGFHILSTQQIFDHFRKNPAFANVPDDVILTYAGQSGFYSGGGQQGESNMAFDPAKPAIVLNSDALRNRMEVFGETPIDALNHETGHHISRVPEIQDALGDVKKILFTNEIKDASGLTKTITNGLYTNDQLVDLFDSQYLKNKSKQEKEQIAKSLGLWDSGLNQLDRENVKNYMQEEILAEVFSNTLSRNLGKNIDDKQIHLLDFARLKLKNNLLKKAAVKMLGLGMDGNVESAVTGAQITPEAQSAARNALRIMQSMNGDFSTITSQPDVPAISKADIKKSRVAAERYGMDSGLFETKTIAQVFDAAGKPIGDAVEITDPAVFEGSWRVGKDGEERLSGYGQIPIELRQLQVPEGGTLSISKQLQTEADGVTPKMLEKGELAKRIKNRAELFKKAIDTPDYGTPGRFEPVYEGSETYRGSFTPMQIQAIKELPEGIVPLKIKKYLLELNDAIVRKDGTRFFVDYAAVMDDKGNYKAFSPKIYDVVPIGLQLSSAGNFLVTTISVGRMREKLNLWADRMPGRLSPWNGSKEAFWQDFSKKYLANWAAQIEGSGYKNGVPVGNNQLDPDYQKAEEKKSILNDYLYLFTEATRPLNLDRTEIPRRKGDPKNKSLDRTIMSMRVDHFAELLSGEHLPKLPIDYGKAIINFLPASAEIEAPSGERGFQSKLQTEIQRKFQGANATPEQLKAVLGNPQNVKPEEIKWSGVMDEIDRLAQENNGKVPVQALVNYLRDEGQVKFEENISGTPTPQSLKKIATETIIDILNAGQVYDEDAKGFLRLWNGSNERLSKQAEVGLNEKLQEAGELRDVSTILEDAEAISYGGTRYQDLQLPGGENYREVVLSMPSDLSRSQAKIDAINKRRKEILEISKEQDLFKRSQTDPEAKALNDSLTAEFVELGKQADQLNADIRDGKTGEQFTSSHFPEVPNYIAHMRVNERTDAEGNDGLFVEEFQSDRHQAGREKGYIEDFKPLSKEEEKRLDILRNQVEELEEQGAEENPTPEYQALYSEVLNLMRRNQGGSIGSPPDAPFRKDWGVQLFKRALRDAVESGKSWIGWTTGIEQIKRYEETLRQQVKSIEWTTEDGLTIVDVQPTKGKRIYLPVKNGKIYRTADQQSLVGKDLAEVIGKEATAKVNESSSGKLTGDDLTIGGEGMKGFYDQILPKEIGKYVAKMGGKVEKSEIGQEITEDDLGMEGLEDATPEELAEFEATGKVVGETVPIWRVNITPEMENVVRAGQMQFMPAEGGFEQIRRDAIDKRNKRRDEAYEILYSIIPETADILKRKINFEDDQQEFNSIPFSMPSVGFDYDRSFHLTKIVRRILDTLDPMADTRAVQNLRRKWDTASPMDKQDIEDRIKKYEDRIKKTASTMKYAFGVFADLTASLPEAKARDLRQDKIVDPWVVLKKHFPNGESKDINKIILELRDVIKFGTEKENFKNSINNVLNSAEVLRDFIDVDQSVIDQLFKDRYNKSEAQMKESEAEFLKEVTNPEFFDVGKTGSAIISQKIEPQGDIRFMPAEQQGMEGVEAPQTYRRISGMIPPLQGVELPEAIAKGAGEFGILRQALQGVEAPIREAAKTPEIPKQQVEVKQEIPVAKVEADAEEEVADTELRSTGIEVPESVDEQSVISNAIKVANSQPWKKGRDFKMDLQRRVMEAAEKAGVTISERTAEAIEYLARVGFKDALIALEQNPNAIGWYDEKTKQALGVMSLLFPEIATDENARFAFTWALAVTSNGLKVDKNFELAERVYRQYRKSGKMPTNIEAGQAQKAINEGLDLFNKLTKEWGMENTRKFMQTDFTVGEISRLSKDLSPGGEFSDTNVRGSAILGPKIGNGFFSNLYGLFDALTMDRWLVRTWGRWTGTLVELNPELTKQATNRLQEAVQKLTPEDKARMDKIIKQDISQMSLEDLSVAIQKASMKPELRQLMNQTETGEEFRKSGNGLAKYLDGQKEAPSGPTERNFIREIFGLMLDELKSDPKYAGLTMADLQAVLWYAEKRLYETAKVKADQDNLDSSDADGYEDDEAPDYANAAIGVAREKGISQKRIDEVLEKIKNDRTTTTRPETQEGDSDQARQQEGAGGFVGKEKQKFQQYVAVTTARRNRTGNEKALWSYSRGGGKDSGDAGVLKPKSKKNLGVKYISEWKPGRKLATMFRNNGLPPVKFLELDSTDKASAQKFADTLQKSKDASVNGAAVYVYPVEDYQGMKLFISESGQSGFALKSDGDIVSVFSMDKGSGRSIMETAIAAGGKKLDAFDTILPEFYGTHGFVEAARIPWNDEFAPEGWDKETFKKFNNGEPDVVMMVLDPKFEGEYEPRTDIYATDYDQAVEMQDSLLKKMNKGVKK